MLPVPWQGALRVRATLTTVRLTARGLRTRVRRSVLTCPAVGAADLRCATLRRDRFQLLAPLQVLCPSPFGSPVLRLAVQVGSTLVRRTYGACEGGSLERWRGLLDR